MNWPENVFGAPSVNSTMTRNGAWLLLGPLRSGRLHLVEVRGERVGAVDDEGQVDEPPRRLAFRGDAEFREAGDSHERRRHHGPRGDRYHAGLVGRVREVDLRRVLDRGHAE